MDYRVLVFIAVFSVLAGAGCLEERNRYFCPDGREVSRSELCFAEEGMCDSVEGILENRNVCNLKWVEVEGGVSGLGLRTSGEGNNYTTFNLEGLRVFAWGHLQLRENDTVRVKGTFHKTKKVGRYSFENEIEAYSVEKR